MWFRGTVPRSAEPDAKADQEDFADIRPKPDREVFVWDSGLKGFGVRMMSSGVASYILKYRNKEGRQRKLAIWTEQRQPHLPGRGSRCRGQYRRHAGFLQLDGGHGGAGHLDRDQAGVADQPDGGGVQLERHGRRQPHLKRLECTLHNTATCLHSCSSLTVLFC